MTSKMEKEEQENMKNLIFNQIKTELKLRNIPYVEKTEHRFRVNSVDITVSWGYGYRGKNWVEASLWSGHKNYYKRTRVSKFETSKFVDKIVELVEIEKQDNELEEKKKNTRDDFKQKMLKVFGKIKADDYSSEISVPLDDEEYGNSMYVRKGYSGYKVSFDMELTDDQLKRIAEILKEGKK